MENKYFYSTAVEWTGERRGDLRSPVLPNLQVDAPPEFKGHEGAWTPEHLFVAAVNSCFMTTFLAIAENSKLEFVSFSAAFEPLKSQLQSEESLWKTNIVTRPKSSGQEAVAEI